MFASTDPVKEMADGKLDGQLPGPALKAQQQAIRLGHCNMLPESQITPMTRVQIARDISMAQTLAAARQQAGAGQREHNRCQRPVQAHPPRGQAGT